MKGGKKNNLVIGIDEVGRGALAGPVVVVAAMVSEYSASRIQNSVGMELRDSKKLSARQRKAWCACIKDCPEILFAVARVYPRNIEKVNISQAANLAALRAYKVLIAKREALIATGGSRGAKRLALNDAPIFLDGGLYLRNRKQQVKKWPHAKTMPKADETIAAVAIASIIAKVYRDRLMCRLAKKYPGYHFEVHKGYGTKVHYKALKKYGASPAHRLTFLKKRPIIER